MNIAVSGSLAGWRSTRAPDLINVRSHPSRASLPTPTRGLRHQILQKRDELPDQPAQRMFAVATWKLLTLTRPTIDRISHLPCKAMRGPILGPKALGVRLVLVRDLGPGVDAVEDRRAHAAGHVRLDVAVEHPRSRVDGLVAQRDPRGAFELGDEGVAVGWVDQVEGVGLGGDGVVSGRVVPYTHGAADPPHFLGVFVHYVGDWEVKGLACFVTTEKNG